MPTSLSFLLFHYFLFCTTNIKVLPVSYPWRRKWQPTPVFLPRKSHGWRSLVGPSPWGHKESDTTEWLTVSYPMPLFMLSPLPGMLSPPTASQFILINFSSSFQIQLSVSPPGEPHPNWLCILLCSQHLVHSWYLNIPYNFFFKRDFLYDYPFMCISPYPHAFIRKGTVFHLCL